MEERDELYRKQRPVVLSYHKCNNSFVVSCNGVLKRAQLLQFHSFLVIIPFVSRRSLLVACQFAAGGLSPGPGLRRLCQRLACPLALRPQRPLAGAALGEGGGRGAHS